MGNVCDKCERRINHPSALARHRASCGGIREKVKRVRRYKRRRMNALSNGSLRRAVGLALKEAHRLRRKADRIERKIAQAIKA